MTALIIIFGWPACFAGQCIIDRAFGWPLRRALTGE